VAQLLLVTLSSIDSYILLMYLTISLWFYHQNQVATC